MTAVTAVTAGRDRGIGVVSVTAAGQTAARRLTEVWPEARRYDGPPREALTRAFAECDGVVCFLAVGATVRLLAPLLSDKHSEPGVVCVDEAGRFAVPVVGGHAGGANELAERVADVLGAQAVVTTASDAAGVTALDTLGADLGFRLQPGSELAAVGAAMLRGERVSLVSDRTEPLPPLPPNVVAVPLPAEPSALSGPLLAVTDRVGELSRPAVVYRPPSIVVGIGSSRGVSADEVRALLDEVLADAGVSPLSVRHLATVEAKRDEPGIVAVAAERGWHLVCHPAERLAAIGVPNPSEVVRAAVGTPS
ncbi:MAG: cobalamin biosynthesis protein, partial [Actinomycetota bacterium]|nr:cobalamin biosynthesis protein [Actinomycetota bacterium]